MIPVASRSGTAPEVAASPYSAHVGGFITGLVLVRIFSRPEWVDVIRARQSPSV